MKKLKLIAFLQALSLSLLLLINVIDLTSVGYAMEWNVPGSGVIGGEAAAEKYRVPVAMPRYYVAKTGDGTNPTAGWETAFKTVQDALSAAELTSGGEIWVAKGIYYPDEGIGQVDNDRESTFEIVENVRMYGGFDTEDTAFSERDWGKNVTVLSGDIDGDDDTDPDGVVTNVGYIHGNNAYHVLTADGTTGIPITRNTILDGFVITAGQANGMVEPHGYAGGLWCDGSGSGDCSPMLSNLTFSGNASLAYGGAIFNNGYSNGTSSPTMSNVNFTFNDAGGSGGAVFNNGEAGGTSSPHFFDVTFSNNSAYSGGALYNFSGNGYSDPVLYKVEFSNNIAVKDGGAIYNNGGSGKSNPSLKDVIFCGNTAVNGGAVYNSGLEGISSPYFINVIFSGNSASTHGGAMYNFAKLGISNPVLENVSFLGNSAGSLGGAVYSDGSEGGICNPKLTNVTFSGNKAGNTAGAMFNNGFEGSCSVEIHNSIMWNNRDSTGTGTINATITNLNASVTLKHSLAQGVGASGSSWTSDASFDDGGGNIDENPKFITPVNPSSAPTTDGNLRLQSSSPAIDAGKNSFSSYPFDLDNLWRIRDGDGDGNLVVDMGAYEYPHTVPHYIFTPLLFR